MSLSLVWNIVTFKHIPSVWPPSQDASDHQDHYILVGIPWDPYKTYTPEN